MTSEDVANGGASTPGEEAPSHHGATEENARTHLHHDKYISNGSLGGHVNHGAQFELEQKQEGGPRSEIPSSVPSPKRKEVVTGGPMEARFQAPALDAFRPDHPIYMANACCECMHYRTAAIVVGVVELVAVALWMAGVGVFYGIQGVHGGAVATQAVVAAVNVVAVAVMFWGVAREEPVLLWPHMIIQMTGIAVGILLTVLSVVAMAAGTSTAFVIFGRIFGPYNVEGIARALGPIWPFCLAVIFDFGAAVGIWFYILTRGCYDYLMDKKFFEALEKKTPAAPAKFVPGAGTEGKKSD